jgi:hypothetical protein
MFPFQRNAVLGACRGSDFLSGAISEVLIYNRVLSPTEREAINSYFADKYRTPYQIRQRDNLPVGMDSSPLGDADTDGLANIAEYALGLEPSSAEAFSPNRLRLVCDGTTLKVTYGRCTRNPDVICQLYRSDDLLTWTRVVDTSEGLTGAIDLRGHSMAIGPEVGRVFFGLRVTLPP